MPINKRKINIRILHKEDFDSVVEHNYKYFLKGIIYNMCYLFLNGGFIVFNVISQSYWWNIPFFISGCLCVLDISKTLEILKKAVQTETLCSALSFNITYGAGEQSHDNK